MLCHAPAGQTNSLVAAVLNKRFAGFFVGHGPGFVGVHLSDATRSVIKARGKRVFRAGVMAHSPAGVARRESLNMSGWLQIFFSDENGPKLDAGAPVWIQQEVVSPDNAQPRQNRGVF